VIATCRTTVPPVTLVIVVPVLVVNVVVIKLALVKPVTVHLPFSTMGVVAGACVRDWKRVKEPLPLS
jgi:hypothetical protein